MTKISDSLNLLPLTVSVVSAEVVVVVVAVVAGVTAVVVLFVAAGEVVVVVFVVLVLVLLVFVFAGAFVVGWVAGWAVVVPGPIWLLCLWILFTSLMRLIPALSFLLLTTALPGSAEANAGMLEATRESTDMHIISAKINIETKDLCLICFFIFKFSPCF